MSASPSGQIQEITFDDHREFMSYLDLRQEHWGDSLNPPWFFRGQADSSWRLTPSAWRKSTPSSFEALRRSIEKLHDQLPHPKYLFRISNSGDIQECIIQGATELEAIFDFSRIADEIGLPSEIPDSGRRQLRWFCKSQTYSIEGDWSFHPGFPTLSDGLAQHHGIPTRLLDWTRNPRYAAYFACERSVVKQKLSDLAVWAVHSEFLHPRLLRVLTCPRSAHSFLHAQEGLFLWSPISDLFFITRGKWPSFEDLILATQDEKETDSLQFLFKGDRRSFIERSERLRTDSPILKKIVLTAEETPSLLRCLYRERISSAILMPTYDHIKDTLEISWNMNQ